jgi:protease-4
MTAEDKHRQEDSDDWQQALIRKLAFASLEEQKKARRWSTFFKLLMFAYLALLLYLYFPALEVEPGAESAHTALVELEGVIAADEEASADNVVEGLRDAFEADNAKGVVLRINSPGGSPVQSGYIYDEIRRLRTLHPEKPLYAVVSDVCASGAYYVAAAADRIYANKASIIGSIGVRMDGFGFVDAIDKLGVERRLLTAGEHKAFLDPFKPVKEKDVAQVKSMLDDIHEQFITAVKAGRGERLDTATPDLFSGYVWTGEQSVDIGLVDALASAGEVAREVIGEKTLVDYTREEDWYERFSKRLGTAIGRGIGQVIGERFSLR